MPPVTHPCTESNSSTSQRATPKRDLGSTRGRRPSCCRWPQRSGMARGTSTCGSAAGRPPRRPRRQLTTSALLADRTAPRPPLRLSESRSHLGEERRGRRGGRRWGRSPQVQLFAPVPQAAWPRALCNGALTQGRACMEAVYTTHSATQVLFLRCDFLSSKAATISYGLKYTPDEAREKQI